MVFRVVGRCLPHAALKYMGAALASLVFFALPGKRANIHRNLRVVLSGSPDFTSPSVERRARRLARRAMTSYGEVLLDFAGFDRLIPRVQRDTVGTPGWEHIDKAVAEGRGAIFVTAHFGHWDMAGVAVAHHCPDKVWAVAESFPHEKLNELVVEQRSSYGIGVVPMDNVRQMTRVLREGKILGILADRPVSSGDGVSVTFFGNETRFPAGTAVLAQLAKCPILVGSLRRRPDGQFVGTILPPIEPVRTGNRDADIAATMQLVAANLEQIIRRSPHQWYMFRDMWPGARASEQRPRSFARQLASYVAALLSESALIRLLRSAQTATIDIGLVQQGKR